MFSYKKFAMLCIDKKTSPTAVASAIGLSAAAASGWKNGKQPRETTIWAIAKALNCDVEDLTEKEDQPAETDELTEDEAAILAKFRSLTDAQKELFLQVFFPSPDRET